MKKIFILFLLFFIVNKCYAQEVIYPNPTGYINDFANVIPDNYEASLGQLIDELKQKTNGVEIAVVTIQSITPLQIEEYSVGLYEKWGIGKKGKDNGVLVLLAVNERKMRIEVGYGLEGALPDGKCGEIRDRFMIPYFKQGELDKGIVFGTEAIIQIVANEYGVQLEGSRDHIHSQQKRDNAVPLPLLLLLLPFIILCRILFFPFLLFSGGYRYRGGSSGMSGFGGGFGGFGGGMSGGGGATGSW